MLVVLCLAKLLATSLVLATGWKGGYIFPDHVRWRFPGTCGEPHISRYSGGSCRRSHDGRRAGCGPASAPVRRAADDHAGAAGDCPAIAVAVVVSALMAALVACALPEKTSYFPVFQWQLPSQLQWQARWLPPCALPCLPRC